MEPAALETIKNLYQVVQARGPYGTMATADLVDRVPALVAEVERLRTGIQCEIDDCDGCGGSGFLTLNDGGEPDEDNCQECAPLRQLLRGD